MCDGSFGFNSSTISAIGNNDNHNTEQQHHNQHDDEDEDDGSYPLQHHDDDDDDDDDDESGDGEQAAAAAIIQRFHARDMLSDARGLRGSKYLRIRELLRRPEAHRITAAFARQRRALRESQQVSLHNRYR